MLHTYTYVPKYLFAFYSSLEKNEGNEHTSIMLIDKASLNDPDSYRSVASVLDQETAINSYQANHGDRNLDNSCATTVDSLDVKCDINTTSDFPNVHQHANVVLADSSNGKMDDNIAFVSQNKTNPFNTAKSSHILQSGNRENNVTSVPKMLTKREKLKHSVSMGYNGNGLCCKMSIIFAICCIIGCCLIPIILYYASQATDRDNAVTDPGYSHEKNISSAAVHML